MKYISVFLLLISVAVTAEAAWFGGPSDYDECILDSMKGVKSDLAARAIIRSCRDKFPDKKKVPQNTRELTPKELGLLTGRGGHSFGDYFSGNLYNGNQTLTVSQVTFVVTVKSDGAESTKTYVDEVTIRPLSTANFGFNIVVGGERADYSWGIIGAKGYE